MNIFDIFDEEEEVVDAMNELLGEIRDADPSIPEVLEAQRELIKAELLHFCESAPVPALAIRSVALCACCTGVIN